MIRGDDETALEQWIADATGSELDALAKGIRRDLDAVKAAITYPWSTSPVEGRINRLKTLKRQMYGRAGYELVAKPATGSCLKAPSGNDGGKTLTCTKSAEDPLIDAESHLDCRRAEIASPPASYIPSGLSSSSGKRRNFSEADKRRIVGEACRPGASVSGVAKKYGLGRRLLFHWKQELAPEGEAETIFLLVVINDEPDPLPDTHARTGMAPVIVERATPGIEVELIGGRRVRFERDADPETVRRLIDLLEGERS